MDSSQYVRVAVNIRPLISSELLIGCTDCITVVPGEPQVLRMSSFIYIQLRGSSAGDMISCRGSPSSAIFNDGVAPLVDALFRGYNATVLAYSQSGCGKTFTMGTNCNGEESIGGIIPEVMDTIFKRIETMRDSTEFLVGVSFFEVEQVIWVVATATTDAISCKLSLGRSWGREVVGSGVAADASMVARKSLGVPLSRLLLLQGPVLEDKRDRRKRKRKRRNKKTGDVEVGGPVAQSNLDGLKITRVMSYFVGLLYLRAAARHRKPIHGRQKSKRYWHGAQVA
ncbi:hypothetical protein NL676_012241 [Syzygium grande]|nr:hypothetical protein NL676_012241 [Syzygium grande]